MKFTRFVLGEEAVTVDEAGFCLGGTVLGGTCPTCNKAVRWNRYDNVVKHKPMGGN
jgi:hypothetical protein